MTDTRFYAEALIGAVESAVDRGAFKEQGTAAVREVIQRLRSAMKKEGV